MKTNEQRMVLRLASESVVAFFCLFLLGGCAIPVFKSDGAYVVQAEELRLLPRTFTCLEAPVDFVIVGTNTPVQINFDLGRSSCLLLNCDDIPLKYASDDIEGDGKVEVRVMCNLRNKTWQIWRTTQIGKEYNTSYSGYSFRTDGGSNESHVLKMQSATNVSVRLVSNWYWK